MINSINSHAIIIRHDVQDEKYQSFASKFNFTVYFNENWIGREGVTGMGTLISDDWVLTASHVANILVKGDKVFANGKVLTIKKIIQHPRWKERNYPFDIALIQLSAKPTSLKSVKLYRGFEEQNKIVTIIGRGDFGNGRVGVVGADQIKRAANNRIIEAKGQWIKYIFDQGEMSVELEGISGPGDSGGPALIHVDGELYLAGVSSWQNTAPAYGQEGLYGVIENYVRVSFFSIWIDQMLTKHSSD